MPQTLPVAMRNYHVDGVLEIDWSDGHRSRYSHEWLRVRCPCADCRGHTPEQARLITGKENVRITGVEPVGNYALRISFDDGHGTGLYEFSALRQELCRCAACSAKHSDEESNSA